MQSLVEYKENVFCIYVSNLICVSFYSEFLAIHRIIIVLLMRPIELELIEDSLKVNRILQSAIRTAV